MLRTIALCYQDFESWPPASVHFHSADEIPYEGHSCDLTLVAITGIEDPLRDGVREAIVECHKAGVTIKMCTGDNVLTTRSIATQSGTYTAGGIIMEGPFFRALNHHECIQVVPRLDPLFHIRARFPWRRSSQDSPTYLGHTPHITYFPFGVVLIIYFLLLLLLQLISTYFCTFFTAYSDQIDLAF